MTPHQYIGLAARLFAIWMAISSIRAIGMYMAMNSSGIPDAAWVAQVLVVLHWVAAIVFWFFPMTLAHALLPRTRYTDELRLPARQAVAAACIVVGLFVVMTQALPALSTYLSTCVVYISSGQPISRMEPERHLDGLAGLMESAAGFFLMWRAGSIAELLVDRLPARKGDSPPL